MPELRNVESEPAATAALAAQKPRHQCDYATDKLGLRARTRLALRMGDGERAQCRGRGFQDVRLRTFVRKRIVKRLWQYENEHKADDPRQEHGDEECAVIDHCAATLSGAGCVSHGFLLEGQVQVVDQQ